MSRLQHVAKVSRMTICLTQIYIQIVVAARVHCEVEWNMVMNEPQQAGADLKLDSSSS